jgi:hypothetical protein
MGHIKNSPLMVLIVAGLLTAACSPTAPTAVSVNLSANPQTALYNASVSLSWVSFNVIEGSCSIPGLLANGAGEGRVTTPALTITQTYRITCRGNDGSTPSASVTINVLPPETENTSLSLVVCDPPFGSTISVAGRVTCTLDYVVFQKGTIVMGLRGDRGNLLAGVQSTSISVDRGTGQVQVWAQIGSAGVAHTSQLDFFLYDNALGIQRELVVSAEYNWR